MFPAPPGWAGGLRGQKLPRAVKGASGPELGPLESSVPGSRRCPSPLSLCSYPRSSPLLSRLLFSQMSGVLVIAAWCFLQVESRHPEIITGNSNHGNFLDNDKWLSTVSQYDKDKYWNKFRDVSTSAF